MRTKPYVRVLAASLGAGLIIPLLHITLTHFWQDNEIDAFTVGFLLTAALLVSLNVAFGLLNRYFPLILPQAKGVTPVQTEIQTGDRIAPMPACSDTSHIQQAQADLKRLKEQLFQSQKMEAIGTLAGGITHDFNNILAAIMGYVELAILDTDPRSKVRFELDQILKAAHRAKDLVRQILSYSRKTDNKHKPMDLNPLVREALKLIRASLPATIDIVQKLECSECLVDANATQIHQVLMNLFTNASQAMGDKGGTLTIGLRKTDLMGAVAANLGLSPGRYLELRINDTGPGIPAELQACIFDPFFTTKPDGSGTGLGLAVVRSIVQNHRGNIDVTSTPDQGACFRVLLPTTTAVSEVPVRGDEYLPKGMESILFIDDEPVLTELAEEMLTRLGYRVMTCCQPEKALAMICKNPHRFDLVISDTTMPGMTGDALAVKIRTIRADLPIVLCSGYSEKINQSNAAQMGINAFLMKPLSLQQLALTLRQVLDHQPRQTKKIHLVQAFLD